KKCDTIIILALELENDLALAREQLTQTERPRIERDVTFFSNIGDEKLVAEKLILHINSGSNLETLLNPKQEYARINYYRYNIKLYTCTLKNIIPIYEVYILCWIKKKIHYYLKLNSKRLKKYLVINFE
ncbi:hypothetical protein ACJX0J_029313, partial [Zea mays]